MNFESPCRHCATVYCYKNCNKYTEWEEEAEKALEKQIPKKIQFTDDGITYCPTCGYTLHQRCGDDKYCNVCGQRIDWEVN